MGEQVGEEGAEDVGDYIAVLERFPLFRRPAAKRVVSRGMCKRGGRTYGKVSLGYFTEYSETEEADGEGENHGCAAVVPYSP